MESFYKHLEVSKPEVIKKWKALIEAAVNYWINSEPTGISDDEFNKLEVRALKEDSFNVRDYVFDKYLKGKRTKNNYIDKIKKYKLHDGSTMLSGIVEVANKLNIKPSDLYCTLKYDGSSIAIYIDPNTGIPKRVVTVGNLNIEDFGVDQTWKLLRFIPNKFPKGICAVQCEAVVDSNVYVGEPDGERFKANGLINSTNYDKIREVSDTLTLIAFRYFTPNGKPLGDYRKVIQSFGVIKNRNNRVLFSPAQILTLEQLLDVRAKGYTETLRTRTVSGTFINDGWVLYSKDGECIMALKYPNSGESTESVKSVVRGIIWNDKSEVGKDSFSANVLIDPVKLKGATITKPSAGSVSKLIKNNITPGAEVGIILANSVIPMVSKVYSPGNGDFNYPTCECGYKLSEKDIYGSLLKCGNSLCSSRLKRMYNCVSESLKSSNNINLDDLLVIDRFKYSKTSLDMNTLLEYVKTQNSREFYNYLSSFLNTDLQKRNLNLVWKAGYITLRTFFPNIES